MPDGQARTRRRLSFRRRLAALRPAPGHVVMVAAGLLAFGLTYAALHRSGGGIEVAMAAVDLRAGVAVEPSMLASAELALPEPGVGDRLLTVSAAEEAIAAGSVAANFVPAGSMLRVSDVVPPPADQPREMALAVDRARAVDGALMAGDLVDLVVVEAGVAGFALTGIRVVAVSDSGSGAGRGMVLTLEVDAPSSLRLAHAIAGGAIQVVKATGAAPPPAGATYPPSSVPQQVGTNG